MHDSAEKAILDQMNMSKEDPILTAKKRNKKMLQ